MNRNQFLVVLVALVVLLAGGAGVMWSERTSWKVEDTRIGQKLFPALTISDVAQIRIQEPSKTLTLAKGSHGWTVIERGDFAADQERIGQLLIKVAGLKIVQHEPLPDSQRARLQLVEPRGKDDANAGTLLELKDSTGKSLARVLLGKKVLKSTEVASAAGAAAGLASGRYVAAAGDPANVSAVSEPLAEAEAKADGWLVRDLVRVDRLKSITATGPDGRQRFALARDNDSAPWKLAGGGDKPDSGKLQDVASSLTYMSLQDVAADAKNAGLDHQVTVRAQTFDGLTYTIRVGDKAGDDRYHVGISVSGELLKQRVPDKGESATDREKKDKEFAERLNKLEEKLAREKQLDRWTYLVSKSSVEALLRDRAQLMPDKKKEEKKKT